MVNLVITGKAVSNTFDNTMEIDTGGAKKVFVIITLVFFCSDFKWSVEKKQNKKKQRIHSSQSQRAQTIQ